MSAVDWAIQSGDAVNFVEAAKAPSMASASTGSGENSAEKKCLEHLKVLLHNALTVVNTQLAAINKQDVVAVAKASGDLLLEIDNVQCFEPRGRFNLKITTTAIFLEGKQFSVLVPVEAVSDVVCLPSFTSAKKEGEDYLAFQLSTPVKVNNKETKHLLINLMRIVNPTTRSKSGDNDVNESAVVMMALQDATGVHISRPQASLFATVRDQKPYLKCYRGTQEGAIYPLQSGVIFVKPLLFISADEIASISAGRGGGSGNTRYVDLLIETADEKTLEFTNIDREELPALQMYVKGYLEARALKQQLLAARSKPKKVKAELVTVDMTSDVTDLCEEASPAGEDLEDSDSDEDDDDYDPDASDSEDGSGRGRKKRVRRGNEDDDEGEGDCDGSGDSSGSDYDTDASSDDNSGDSNGESSDAESDAGSAVSRSIGSDAKRGSVPVAAKKTAGVAQPKKAASNKTTAANKTTKPAADAKKGTEVSTKHSSAGPSKVVRKPGEKVERFASAATTATVVAPAVKVESGVVNLTQDEDVVLKPHGAAPVKEGRKSSQPQKKVASVKREPPGAVAATHTAGEGEVIVPEVDSLEGAGSKAAVKSEPIVVVDMSNDVVQVKHEPVVKSASPVAPSVGVKRTIMDMFAMQKKKTASTAGAASSAESTTVKPSEDVGITDLSV